MQVRPAKPADIPAIAALWHSGWHQAHASIVPPAVTALRTSEECASRAMAHLDQTQVGWVDGHLAGFFMLEADELYQFYVDAAFQGTGLATDLMRVAEAALGAGSKWLACSVGNDRAAAFFTKCGWVQTCVTPYEVETGAGPLLVDVWRYEKQIGRT